MALSPENTLTTLQKLQKSHELSIIKLSEPISAPLKPGDRTSNGSAADPLENPSPASLETDLAHYKELFSKLRFSYLEQVTKEKFIRAIVGDPPLVVEHQENLDLEASLLLSKSSLKAQKIEVAELVEELEKRGRELCRKYEHIQLQTKQLSELPLKISGLEENIQKLKNEQNGIDGEGISHPNLRLGLDRTRELVEEKERERRDLDRQLEQLQVQVPRKTKEVERLNAELVPLDAKRTISVAAAREAQRRKEEGAGGTGDDLEERGRWWRGVEGGLRGVLGVESDA
ncbi:30623936-a1f2-4476-8d96-3fcaf446d80e [Sclerotinia trifoliorum]|uniref:30623936-a1f2-4476-8d96-3fcaf446d80e n=1 Tax=Sclerotinia trifoliorum TaxID=28548 RepID=A0A8H2ZRB2_9HELO|nr:30623936-a1f2-4476-8d96-3fcaf446d80e [Sclerotinia trifoliorum]